MSFSTEDFLGNTPTRFVSEIRAPQIALANRVEKAIRTKTNLVAQAGTGTGKTHALLIPAILCGKNVVVSTATVALQAQYLRELSNLKRLFEPLGIKFTYAQKKGRGHYLCLKAYEEQLTVFARDKYFQADSKKKEALVNFRKWAGQTTFGDKAELNDFGIDIPSWWHYVSAEDCIGAVSCDLRDQCGYLQAGDRCRHARIIVANHSILGINLKIKGKILPVHNVCLIDEAHKAPEMLQNALADTLSENAVRQITKFLEKHYLVDFCNISVMEHWEDSHQKMFELLIKNAGMIMKGGNQRGKTLVSFNSINTGYSPGGLSTLTEDATVLAEELSNLLNLKLLRNGAISTPGYTVHDSTVFHIYVDPSIDEETTSACFEALDHHLMNKYQKKSNIEPDVEELSKKVATHDELSKGAIMVALRKVQTYLSQIKNLSASLEKCENMQGDNELLYLEAPVSSRGSYKLCRSSVFIGDILKEKLFSKMDTVVSSSATIPFDWHFTEMGYTEETATFIAPSPFDYGNKVFLYTNSKIPPHPSRDWRAKGWSTEQREEKLVEYFDALASQIIDLCDASYGGAFVLFTSRIEMNEVFARVAPKIKYPIKAQTEESSPVSLEKWFRSESNPVLFGLRSFWEGIDIQGSQLRSVILTKTPFPIRGDVIIEAKKAILEKQSFDSFSKLEVPEMIMHVLQIFGRLIRTREDYGMFAILENRFANEWGEPGKYSNRLYRALPTSPNKRIPVTDELSVVRKAYKAISFMNFVRGLYTAGKAAVGTMAANGEPF